MRNPILKREGLTHGIIVVCHNLLSCGIYTALVSLVFGTAIPTSFSILMKMFLHLLCTSYMHVIAAMYFTTFESLIVYRNARRPCYVSKRAYSCLVREFWAVTFVKA